MNDWLLREVASMLVESQELTSQQAVTNDTNLIKYKQEQSLWDVPGGPVAKTTSSQCWGHKFDPWSGN